MVELSQLSDYVVHIPRAVKDFVSCTSKPHDIGHRLVYFLSGITGLSMGLLLPLRHAAKSSVHMNFRNIFPGMARKATAESVLQDVKWPAEFPFTANDFRRQDESSDSIFYEYPRVGVFHIDEFAVRAIMNYYKKTLKPNSDILDLCSSWVSHLPADYKEKSLTVLGMSGPELKANTRATTRVVQDLNKDPSLPFADGSFDIITNAVSVDYLARPLQVFKEMRRVLRPGGKAIMSFSNRCFPTKVIDIWLRTTDLEHVFIVGSYFHYTEGFGAPRGKDLKPGIFSDPMYVVEADAV